MKKELGDFSLKARGCVILLQSHLVGVARSPKSRDLLLPLLVSFDEQLVSDGVMRLH